MDGRPLIYFMHQYKFQFLNVEFNWNWNMQEMDRGLEYLKQSANLVAMGIKIIVLLALSILISAIIINKENKLERIDKQR